jgi:hypothetical protein
VVVEKSRRLQRLHSTKGVSFSPGRLQHGIEPFKEKVLDHAYFVNYEDIGALEPLPNLLVSGGIVSELEQREFLLG